MNAPQDLGPDFRSWLGDIPSMPPDLPTRTIEETDHTPQRRRRPWFLPSRTPTAGADDGKEHTLSTVLTSTTRGLRSAPSGGTRTMFSATKLIAAVTVVALSGALLLAGPFTQKADPSEPLAAVDDSLAATLFSGQMSDLSNDDPGKSESYDWGYSIADRLFSAELELTDERLSGPARIRSNFYARDWDWQEALSIFLENDGGSWVGTGRGYMDPASTGGSLGAGLHMQVVLQGQGGYEGLNAIMAIDQVSSDQPLEVSGAITHLDLPPAPGPAPRTFESAGD
jgi:hypothetical protein